jgi:hypothetical protein
MALSAVLHVRAQRAFVHEPTPLSDRARRNILRVNEQLKAREVK